LSFSKVGIIHDDEDIWLARQERKRNILPEKFGIWATDLLCSTGFVLD
jgi:hypothetical protein